MDEPPRDPLLGRVIGPNIQFLRALGRGSVGRVYAAHHGGLDKTVAVKVLEPDTAVSGDLVRRFRDEAKAASRLDHPNVVRVLDCGIDSADGLSYIVMEFVEGETLERALEASPKMTPARSVVIMRQVCSALNAAHRAGIVHRDVKPANIMLAHRQGSHSASRDVVKVCDFGVAKILSTDDPGLTAVGVVLGTPVYLSPEQASGHPVDHRADLYACGVILYRMLSGALPFPATSARDLLIAHATCEPPNIRERAPEIEPSLAAVVHRAMAKDPDDRFQSARELQAALDGVVAVPILETPMRAPAAETSASLRPTASAPADETTHCMRSPVPSRLDDATALPRPSRIAAYGIAALAIVVAASLPMFLQDRGPPAPTIEPAQNSPAESPREIRAPTPPSVALANVEVPTTVRITIEGPPPGTTVATSRGVLGVLPGPIEVPRDAEILDLVFRATGYLDARASIVPTADLVVHVEMQPDLGPANPSGRQRKRLGRFDLEAPGEERRSE